VFGRRRVRISARTSAILTEDFRVFPWSLYANTETVSQLGQGSFLPDPSCSLFIEHLNIARYTVWIGRAIAQAVSSWLPIAAVRCSRSGRYVGFCDGRSGAGAGFLRVLRFPLPNSFYQLLQKIIIIIINQSIIGDSTIGQMGKRLWPQYKGLIDT
jgi:hypothetical protein